MSLNFKKWVAKPMNTSKLVMGTIHVRFSNSVENSCSDVPENQDNSPRSLLILVTLKFRFVTGEISCRHCAMTHFTPKSGQWFLRQKRKTSLLRILIKSRSFNTPRSFNTLAIQCMSTLVLATYSRWCRGTIHITLYLIPIGLSNVRFVGEQLTPKPYTPHAVRQE